MSNSLIEETKKKYEDEINRLRDVAEATQELYQRQFNEIKNQEKILVDEYNTKIQEITIGIERLRGAYTAIVDMEEGKDPTLVTNGMLSDSKIDNTETEPVEDSTVEDKTGISEEVKQKAHKAVSKAMEKDLVTPYKEFAESELGKETAVKDVKKIVSKVPEPELAKPHKNDGSTLTPDEAEALKSVINGVEDVSTKSTNFEGNIEKEVDPKDIPDYLKEEYNAK